MDETSSGINKGQAVGATPEPITESWRNRYADLNKRVVADGLVALSPEEQAEWRRYQDAMESGINPESQSEDSLSKEEYFDFLRLNEAQVRAVKEDDFTPEDAQVLNRLRRRIKANPSEEYAKWHEEYQLSRTK